MRYAANLSILFTELELTARPAAARAAGFEAVEFWWPFPTATPDADAVTAFTTAIRDAEVQLIGLNFYADDLKAGHRGVVSWPGREAEFQAGVRAAVRIGASLGCRKFNALYGNRLPDTDPAVQDAVALANLRFAADAVSEIGGTVLLEPVSGMPAYPLTTAAHALAVMDQVEGLGLLADLYHLSVNGDDVDRVIREHTDRISHVQIADAPGRHEPGTGSLTIKRWLRALADRGYSGHVAAEYVPASTTTEGLGWLTEFAEEIA
ncbi:MAG TPA: TIM barrel protein [Pseudonocardiaceae bacterium]|nr:TIM barrel protein [Pseudonocardiaceae bacterium]